MILYSVYDKVGKEFLPPFVSKNDDTAIRIFKDSAEKNPHIEDYILYQVVNLDDLTGVVSGQQPVQVITGQEVLDAIRKD